MPRNEISAHQVILVRHGQAALNAAGRLRGRLDPPLSAIGAQEVHGLTNALIQWHPGRVVTGPLRRTLQTAELIGLATTSEPVVDADLQDRDYGVWAGHLKAEVLALWGCLDNAPGVEPADEVRVRALRVLHTSLLTRAIRTAWAPAHTGRLRCVTGKTPIPLINLEGFIPLKRGGDQSDFTARRSVSTLARRCTGKGREPR